MYTDHPVDNELEAREADTAVWDAREVERPVRVADVHHDLDRHLRQRAELDPGLVEVELPLVDVAGVPLGAGYRDGLTLADRPGRIAATHDRRDPELPGDDRRMAR